MKFKGLILILAMAFSGVAQASDKVECAPDMPLWYGANVSLLENASQALYQVSASGGFRTADLICSYQDCVGFINGIKSEAKLEFGHVNNKYVPTAVVLDTDDRIVRFTCTH